ncbi:MAG: OsmC family peroxiredoxin, partial [Desulfovibrio sp.]
MSQALSVSLERKGTVIDVNYDTTALQNIHVDLNEVAEDDRSGSAKKLLGASVLYCYTAALDKALDVRGAKYDAIKGRATVTAGTDDKGRGRILG